jgi:putative copper export protein
MYSVLETAPLLDTIRLSIHVLAASVWVGGQIVMAGLVPVARKEAPGLTKKLGTQFSYLAWPAYFVLIATGIWNVVALNPAKASTGWMIALWLIIAMTAISGISAFLHSRAKSVQQLALWGSLSGISAVAALVLGIILAG